MHKQPPKHGVSSCFGLNISLHVVLVNPYDLPVGLALSSPLWRGACSSEKESDVLSVAQLGGGQSQDSPSSTTHRTFRAPSGSPLPSTRSHCTQGCHSPSLPGRSPPLSLRPPLPHSPAQSGSNPGVSCPLSIPLSAVSPATRLFGSWWPRPRLK